MKVYYYTVVLEPVTEGGYNVVVPAIPEICTFGNTLEEAKELAADASGVGISQATKTIT